ncbi:MAG: aspartate kinase [Promethearchaeota archaeon]
MEKLVIMKLGGSCLRDGPSFHQSLNIIKEYVKKNRVIIVNSAISGVTDKLIEFYDIACQDGSNSIYVLNELFELHENIITTIMSPNSEEYDNTLKFLKKNIEELTQLGRVIQLLRPSQNILDLVLSYGERLSTYIFSQYLKSQGYISRFISSNEIILTDDNFGRALPLLDETEAILKKKMIPLLKSNDSLILCITGFYGSTKEKKITTLGRGGTDLTAAIVAYALKSAYDCRVIYWKDVQGFLNADPELCPKSSLLKSISYIEAKELAFFGSKVLHPLCLDVNEKREIPSEIRDFNNPFSPEYTKITKEIIKDEKIIKAITSIKRLSMVTIESGTMISLPGTVSKLFSLLGENNIAINFISQSSSENNLTFGIDIEDSMKVSALLRNSPFFGKQWFSIKIDNDVSLIAVIGAGMLHTPGIAGKIFTTLGHNNINVRAIAQGSSELNITIIVERKDCKKAVNVLFDAFINDNK